MEAKQDRQIAIVNELLEKYGMEQTFSGNPELKTDFLIFILTVAQALVDEGRIPEREFVIAIQRSVFSD